MSLRKLVLSRMNPKNVNLLVEAEILDWSLRLPSYAEESLDELSRLDRQMLKKDYLSRRVERLQQECIYLLDTVIRYDTEPEGLAKSQLAGMLDLRNLVVACLEDTLLGLFREYPKEIITDINMPMTQFNREIPFMENQLVLLESAFDRLNIEGGLRLAITSELRNLIALKTCSYDALNYFRNLLAQIFRLFNHSGGQGANNDLLELLAVYDFNTHGVVKYYTKLILKEIFQIPEAPEQMEYIHRKMAFFDPQRPRKKIRSFDSNQCSLPAMLHSCLLVEALCLREKDKRLRRFGEEEVRSNQGGYRKLKGVLGREVDYKIRFNMSVDVLAYLIKLMVNTNMIEPGVKTELMRFVAGCFQTPGTGIGGIAPGSFQTRYKNVVQSTAVTMKASLGKMIREVEREFF